MLFNTVRQFADINVQRSCVAEPKAIPLRATKLFYLDTRLATVIKLRWNMIAGSDERPHIHAAPSRIDQRWFNNNKTDSSAKYRTRTAMMVNTFDFIGSVLARSCSFMKLFSIYSWACDVTKMGYFCWIVKWMIDRFSFEQYWDTKFVKGLVRATGLSRYLILEWIKIAQIILFQRTSKVLHILTNWYWFQNCLRTIIFILGTQTGITVVELSKYGQRTSVETIIICNHE